jgi:benzoyl-CoA reductase/2-hydroxyglutaryl-CoA dehydratase subunit BcrC/BadD/HgdB
MVKTVANDHLNVKNDARIKKRNQKLKSDAADGVTLKSQKYRQHQMPSIDVYKRWKED